MALPLLLLLHMHSFQMDLVCIFNQNYLQLPRFLLSSPGCNFCEAVKLTVSCCWLLTPCLCLQITLFRLCRDLQVFLSALLALSCLDLWISFSVSCLIWLLHSVWPLLPPAAAAVAPLSAALKKRVRRCLLNTSFVWECSKMRLPPTKELQVVNFLQVGMAPAPAQEEASTCKASSPPAQSKPPLQINQINQIFKPHPRANSRIEYWQSRFDRACAPKTKRGLKLLLLKEIASQFWLTKQVSTFEQKACEEKVLYDWVQEKATYEWEQ